MGKEKKPANVGPYEFFEELGSGATSTVRLAKNTLTEQQVAIKIVTHSESKVFDEEVIESELAAMKKLNHIHVLKLYGIIRDKKKSYIILELADGGALLDFVLEQPPEKLIEVGLHYFQELIYGLKYLHDHGVAHRDLKLENLLLDGNGVLKISDFGMSRLFNDNAGMSTFCGTEDYMAPEVYKGGVYDGTMADIWSCGVILYGMLVGNFPFQDTAAIRAVRYDLPRHLPPQAKDLIRKIFVANPNNRITMQGIMEDPWFTSAHKKSNLLSALATAKTEGDGSSDGAARGLAMLRTKSFAVAAVFKVIGSWQSTDFQGAARPLVHVSSERLRMLCRLLSEMGIVDSFNSREVHSSPSYKKHCTLIGEAQRIELQGVGHDDIVAGFLNLYNTLLIHSVLNSEASLASLSRKEKEKFYDMHSYIVAFEQYSLADIYHGVLRCNQLRQWSFRPPFYRKGDPRLSFLPSSFDPRIHFAISYLTKSSPPLRIYRASTLDEQLTQATKEYLADIVTIDTSKKKVFLPEQFSWYEKDFGSSAVARLEWSMPFLSEEKRSTISTLLVAGAVDLGYVPHDWAFYVHDATGDLLSSPPMSPDSPPATPPTHSASGDLPSDPTADPPTTAAAAPAADPPSTLAPPRTSAPSASSTTLTVSTTTPAPARRASEGSAAAGAAAMSPTAEEKKKSGVCVVL